MESKTKNKQSMYMLKQMVAKAFNGTKISEEGNSVVELKDGYFNIAYSIKLENGKEVVLKIAPPIDAEIMSYEKNMMATEVKIMKLVKDKTKVPIPCIYYYDNSKSLCSAEYFFMEKIEGDSYFSIKESISKKEQENIEKQIGKYNCAINEVTGKYFGYDGQKEMQGSSWKQVFVKLIDELLIDGEKKNVDIGLPYEKIKKIVNRFAGSLEIVTIPRLVHWDLWDGNVMVKDGKVTGIIDFERAMWADYLTEYYFKEINESSEAFLEGYNKHYFSKAEKIRRMLYNIHLFLIMIIECSYRNYSDDCQYNCAKEKLLNEVSKINLI